eukprot:UN30893
MDFSEFTTDPKEMERFIRKIQPVLIEEFDIGCRDELYRVVPLDDPMSEPIFWIERTLGNLLGTCNFGVHLNGYTKNIITGKPEHIWLGKRAPDKNTYPSHLDQVVAGGLGDGMSVFDCLIKECKEEANLDEALSKQSKHVNTLYSSTSTSKGRMITEIIYR